MKFAEQGRHWKQNRVSQYTYGKNFEPTTLLSKETERERKKNTHKYYCLCSMTVNFCEKKKIKISNTKTQVFVFCVRLMTYGNLENLLTIRE